MEGIFSFVSRHPRIVLAAVCLAAFGGWRVAENLAVDVFPDISVPRAAIVRIGLQPTVFIRDEHDEDRFLAIGVTPGESSGGWTAVTGLLDDEDLEVVVQGAYELKLARTADTTKPTGHFHADGTFHEGEDH